MSCPDCFRGGAATGTPTGTTQVLHSHTTYIAKPAVAGSGTPTIILFTDAFGHQLPNNLLLADALAAKLNMTVLVPDIIPGGPMSPAILPLMDTFSSPAASYLAKALALGRAMVHVVPFFARASPQKPASTGPCEAFARAVSAGLGGAKLGVAGYCWGGFQALHVGGLGERVADAVFVAHPAKYETGQVVGAVDRGVRVSFAHAGLDMSLPGAKVEETRAAMEEREGFEVRVYEGCVHGFAVRATPGKQVEADAADEALQQAVEWFKKWL